MSQKTHKEIAADILIVTIEKFPTKFDGRSAEEVAQNLADAYTIIQKAVLDAPLKRETNEQQ